MKSPTLLLFSFFLGISLSVLPAKEQPKNVLFLSIDDLNTWLLQDPNRYGGSVIAPNIRKLAASGVNFTHAYCASPKCSPSRTAVFSGVAPWNSGLWENSQTIKESELITGVPHLSKYFRDHGYYTAKAGKITHGYDQADAWDDELRGVKVSRREAPPGAPLNGLAQSKSGKLTEGDWGPTHLAEAEMYDYLQANYAIEQLQKDHENPFFIACGVFLPHMPWYVPQKYLDMYPLDEIVLPEFEKDDLDDVPPLGKAFASVSTVERILEHDQHKKAVQAYLAATTFVDAQMGRILDALDKSPYRDNTVVVLWSDHGFHLGEKMHWQKGSLWEEATNCLLLIRAPGVSSEEGAVSEQFASLLDIYPTLVELCGLPTPGHLDGKSLVPVLQDPNAALSDHAITAYDGQIAVRTKDFRYIRYSDGEEELYDRKNDPHEWVNQSNNPEFKPIKERLNALLPARDEMHKGLPFSR